jgi:hypothetical protein
MGCMMHKSRLEAPLASPVANPMYPWEEGAMDYQWNIAKCGGPYHVLLSKMEWSITRRVAAEYPNTTQFYFRKIDKTRQSAMSRTILVEQEPVIKKVKCN